MKLSIIVPVLNEAVGIEAALEALAPLRARGHELVVVDGGSADGTPALAAPHADRVLAAPRGRASQMNFGAAAASGDALVFLHADTRLPPQAEQRIEAALASRKHGWGRFDVRIEGESRLLATVAFCMNLRSRLSGIATGDQAMFATRATFDAVGGFPAIALMEDIEFSRRAKRISPPACLHARVTTSGRRWEREGVLRTVVLMWRLRLAYFLGAHPDALESRYRFKA